MLTRVKRRKKNERPLWRKLANEDKYEEAFVELTELANTGDAEAQFWLGHTYLDGALGERPNRELAIFWLKVAMAQQHALATYIYTKVFDKPNKLQKETFKHDPLVLALYYDDSCRYINAWACIRQCNDIEHPYMQYLKGKHMYNGWHKMREDTKFILDGRRLLEKAANGGFYDAQSHLFNKTHGIECWKWAHKMELSRPMKSGVLDCVCKRCKKMQYTPSRYKAMNVTIVFILIHRHTKYSLLHKDIVSWMSQRIWRILMKL